METVSWATSPSDLWIEKLWRIDLEVSHPASQGLLDAGCRVAHPASAALLWLRD